jgi:nucleotide-binding universal stress UspA family protein
MLLSDAAKARSSPVFGRILCATDGSTTGEAAVRLAARIAGPGGALEIVAIAPPYLPGAPHPQPRQIEALVNARAIAATLGVSAEGHIVEAAGEPAGVLEHAAGHDLLVVPPSDADAVLAAARTSVLVARPTPDDRDSVFVALDDSPAVHHAVSVGAVLVTHLRASVAIVATPEHDEQSARVTAILCAAKSRDASLIVLGSRPGAPAASISRAVAREASCSVLALGPGHTANY